MNKTLKDLEQLINLHGAAQVAVWMGYKDTRPIRQWIQRKSIPEPRIVRVKKLLNEKGFK